MHTEVSRRTMNSLQNYKRKVKQAFLLKKLTKLLQADTEGYNEFISNLQRHRRSNFSRVLLEEIRSTGLWRWCISITTSILDIIHRLILYL
jgi:hypothetical protein